MKCRLCSRDAVKHVCFSPLDVRGGKYAPFRLNGWYCDFHSCMNSTQIADLARKMDRAALQKGGKQ